MQTTTTEFQSNAASHIRKVDSRALISFNRTFDASVSFFTITTSAVGGTDVLRPDNSDVIQEWDKYEYTDYTDRLIQAEYTHEEMPYSSVTKGYGTLVLDNTDDYFTQGSGSAVDGSVRPNRPVQLFAGFDGEVVRTFVGLTQDAGRIDEKQKTITFSLVGFFEQLYNRRLDEESMLFNKRTDEVLDALFTGVGLTSGQYSLDTGYNLMPYVLLDKRDKLGKHVERLIQAEMGRLFIDENGLITFKNRQNYDDAPVAEFSKHNIFSLRRKDDSDIKNVIELSGEIRAVLTTQDVGFLTRAELVPAGQTADVWVTFIDPVTSIQTPLERSVATTSYYRANTESDNSGSAVTSGVSITSSTLFGQSYKATFSNNIGFDIWITELKLFGTPVKVVEEISVQEVDQTSIDEFDEQVLSIENEYFQDVDQTQSKAKMLLEDYKEFYPIERVQILANPALQIGDAITIHNDGITRDYKITRNNIVISRAKIQQFIDVKAFTRYTYFTIGQSAIAGEDRIAP